jgi:hypothetical protein
MLTRRQKRGSNKEWKQASDGQRTNPFARQVHVGKRSNMPSTSGWRELKR